jgi:hypothetical protein
MDTPFLDELMKWLNHDHPDATIRIGKRGAASITWSADNDTQPVVLLTDELTLAAAVTSLGRECRDALWPGRTEVEAGLSILTLHLWEILATRVITEPLRITADGLDWPD